METLLLFQIDKLKDGKITKTYKIYANGDIKGFDDDGSGYSISNHLPHHFRKVGISMTAAFPSMAEAMMDGNKKALKTKMSNSQLQLGIMQNRIAATTLELELLNNQIIAKKGEVLSNTVAFLKEPGSDKGR